MKNILSFTLALVLLLSCFILPVSALNQSEPLIGGAFDTESAASMASQDEATRDEATPDEATPDEATPDEAPPEDTAERFKHFLLYELDDARKTGKSDQELIDEKAHQLSLNAYQVSYFLGETGMRDKVNWSYKVWFNDRVTYKGARLQTGQIAYLSDIPQSISGSINYDADGIRPLEGLKKYPSSGFSFPLATEEFGNLYQIDYTVSKGRVDFSYTLKDLKAAEEFFDVRLKTHDGRNLFTLFTCVLEVISDAGRYYWQSDLEIKDTNGDWLYKDHQAMKAGSAIQDMFPMDFFPEPDDFIDPKPALLMGDADQDGFVTVIDATVIQKYKAKLIGEEKINLEAADVDGDRSVTVLDATRIQKFKSKLCNLDGSTPYTD